MVRHRTAAQVSLPTGYWQILEIMEQKGMGKDRSALFKEAVELLADKHGMALEIEPEEEETKSAARKHK